MPAPWNAIGEDVSGVLDQFRVDMYKNGAGGSLF